MKARRLGIADNPLLLRNLRDCTPRTKSTPPRKRTLSTLPLNPPPLGATTKNNWRSCPFPRHCSSRTRSGTPCILNPNRWTNRCHCICICCRKSNIINRRMRTLDNRTLKARSTRCMNNGNSCRFHHWHPYKAWNCSSVLLADTSSFDSTRIPRYSRFRINFRRRDQRHTLRWTPCTRPSFQSTWSNKHCRAIPIHPARWKTGTCGYSFRGKPFDNNWRIFRDCAVFRNTRLGSLNRTRWSHCLLLRLLSVEWNEYEGSAYHPLWCSTLKLNRVSKAYHRTRFLQL